MYIVAITFLLNTFSTWLKVNHLITHVYILVLTDIISKKDKKNIYISLCKQMSTMLKYEKRANKNMKAYDH